MQKYFTILLLIPILLSCANDDNGDSNTGSFEYTVSGSSSANITGTDCRFGPSTGSSSFITMNAGVDVLTLNVLLPALVPGDYQVNAGFVNGVFQPSMPGDSRGELQLGSIFSGSQKFYNTASGDGGRVTITSIDGNVLRGNFQVNMLELVGGTAGNEPKIDVAGEFTALMQ